MKSLFLKHHIRLATLMLVFMLLTTSVFSQTSYQFNGRQLIEDAPYYLDVTTSDTLVISPSKLLIRFAVGLENQGNLFVTNNLGLINAGNLFGKYVYNKHDSIDFIPTIILLENHYTIDEVMLDYCLTYPRGILQRMNDTTALLYQNTNIAGDDCIEGLIFPEESGWFWELQKSKICLDYSTSPWDFCHRAWRYTTGSPEIIVALIDRGLMWDDDDFYPDNGLGWNYVENTSNVYPDNTHDDIELGTTHASIIGARNNTYALAGVAGGNHASGEEIVEGTTLMILKATTDNYTLSGIAAALSIDHAVNHNARIINFPWATSNPEMIWWLDEAISYAIANNVVIFAPTGDYWDEGPGYDVLWPANRDDVIAVGATNMDNYRATWYTSSFGWNGSRYGNATQISLPGKQVYIRDIYWPTGFSDFSSTTISTSLASGIAALILAEYPCLTNQEIKDIMIESCVEVGGYNYNHDPNKPGHSLQLGYGLLDAYIAISTVRALFEDSYITQNETWASNTIKGNIIIESGATLSLNSIELGIFTGKKIIIKQGGKLIVNGGKITSHCGDTWQGIEVWGNNQTHQFPNAQGNLAQGYLELNDAVIENAINAVSLWKPNDYSATGGIVIANNTVFRNNKKSVHALHYTNFHPGNGKEMDYRASFTRCTFEIDENYHGAEMFYKHVDLASVNGVKFSACHFSLSPLAPDVSEWNSGIAAYSAGFSVVGICTLFNQNTCIEYDPSTFTGFTLGAIDVKNTQATTRTFKVKHALFNGNAYGIRVSGINNFTVLNSVFNIAHNSKEMEPCDDEGKSASGYGIHMTGCTGFAIEENYFTKASGAPGGNYTGILCKDSKSFQDIIYRNTFTGLSYGNFAEGDNRLFNDDLVGLEYQCNTNTGNNRDFIVTGDEEPQIRGYQGSMSKEARNTFSSGVQLPDGHFKNTGTQVINYCYNTNPPVYYTPYHVMLIPNAGANTCPPNYGGGSGGSTKDVVLTGDEKQEAELSFANNLADFNNVKSLFDNLKDGGNTQALTIEVETSWPSDMWALRDELLGKSPHLSQEVLMAAADKTDVLPESILFEILSANPDELRKEELISNLENKDQPLPAYMISILRQLAGGITYKTILQHDMARYQAGKTQATYKLIRSCLNDTVTDYTYLRTWLNNLDNLNADMQIVAAYLAEENYTAAQTMLNLIPATRSLEGNALAGYNDYKSMMQMQMAWQQQGRSIFELDSLEVDVLLDFAENTSGKAAMMARGILEYAYGHHYCNCLPVDDAGAWKSTAAMPGSDVDNGLSIQAVPNPASTWVAFTFTLPVHVNEAVLHITDVHGRNITSFLMTAKQGQQVWDIRDEKKGTYLYSLKAGTLRKNGKLIIK